MRIELNDPAYTEDLAAFLERCDCTVRIVAAGLLDVDARALPIDVDPALRQPQLELESYVRVWTLLRHVDARLVAPPCTCS